MVTVVFVFVWLVEIEREKQCERKRESKVKENLWLVMDGWKEVIEGKNF
jgi:hypothetical protein